MLHRIHTFWKVDGVWKHWVWGWLGTTFPRSSKVSERETPMNPPPISIKCTTPFSTGLSQQKPMLVHLLLLPPRSSTHDHLLAWRLFAILRVSPQEYILQGSIPASPAHKRRLFNYLFHYRDTTMSSLKSTSACRIWLCFKGKSCCIVVRTLDMASALLDFWGCSAAFLTLDCAVQQQVSRMYPSCMAEAYINWLATPCYPSHWPLATTILLSDSMSLTIMCLI